MATDQITQPGRTGDESRSLATDPRSDPRMVAALRPFGLTDNSAAPPLTRDSPIEAILELTAEAEAGFEAVFEALMAELPLVEGVERSTVTIPGSGGHDVTLYIHRPANAAGDLPAILHLHGGGMVLTSAAGVVPSRWRDELAAAGTVTIGVEFRNAGGKLGAHPFPAGLDDCADALRWTGDHKADLNISGIVLSGDSGGANLALSLAIRARKAGWIGLVDGVYAQCPYVYGGWGEPNDALPSLQENDGYFVSLRLLGLLAEAYDPGALNRENPTAWPYFASLHDLDGLPPHVISVNELDPLRDEGLAVYRRLLEAGVDAVGRVNLGVGHIGDSLFRSAIPSLYESIVRDVSGFAKSVTR